MVRRPVRTAIRQAYEASRKREHLVASTTGTSTPARCSTWIPPLTSHRASVRHAKAKAVSRESGSRDAKQQAVHGVLAVPPWHTCMFERCAHPSHVVGPGARETCGV